MTLVSVDVKLVGLESNIDDIISSSDIGGREHLELIIEEGLRVLLILRDGDTKGVLHDDIGAHLTELDLEVSHVQINLKWYVSTELLLE